MLKPQLLLLSALALLPACTPSQPAPPDSGSLTPAASVNTSLAWQPIPGATSYAVYFGPQPNNSPHTNDVPFQCLVAKPSFTLETLAPNTTYNWFVVPSNQSATLLGPFHSFTTAPADPASPNFWPIKMANTIRTLYPTPDKLKGWNYTEGMVIDALLDIALRTHRDADITFAQAWLDRFVRPDGTIDPAQYPLTLFSLDRVRPGNALLTMYRLTKQEKYLKAASELISQLDQQPRTSDGGFWHRSTYPNQMWLDGTYMADVFLAKFAAATNQPKYFDEAAKQILLLHTHTFDPATGLYYHGYDQTKTRPWANPTTGDSPEFWGRAIGWYAMAMADILETLPQDHPARAQILANFQNLCQSLLQYQDHDTAMWFQIINKPTAPKNYVETSCSIMFAYAFAKGASHHWLPPQFADQARRAARGILNHKIDLLPDGTLAIKDTVSVGTLGPGGGTYDYYVSVPLATNDEKSLGAFMYLTMALTDLPVQK